MAVTRTCAVTITPQSESEITLRLMAMRMQIAFSGSSMKIAYRPHEIRPFKAIWPGRDSKTYNFTKIDRLETYVHKQTRHAAIRLGRIVGR